MSLPDDATAEPAPTALATVDPATGEPGRVFVRHSLGEAQAIVAQVAAAQASWKATPMAGRATFIRRVAGVLRSNREQYVRLMTAEMGKTVTDGVAEIEKCIWVADYFADHAETYLAPQPVDLSDGAAAGAAKAFITYQPLGVVLAIMPWNFPFWQALRFAIPHLLAGNAGVLKHASNVPGCALALESVFRAAGCPENIFRTVLVGSEQVRALIEDDNIAAVTITGSVAAGKAVAAVAGGVLKKVVLELGGSDAYLVLEDADIAHAAKVCAEARMKNGGQSCDAGKRFIVVDAVRAAFEAAFVEEMRGFEIGDPTDPRTRLGPMSSVEARDQIAGQVQRSVERGAKVLLGGQVPDRPGAWYPATVLTDVALGQPAHDDEVFGPVGAIIPAKDEDDAIRIANASRFGLGAVVLTQDLARGERIAAERLEAGSAYVNQVIRSDPRLPFGGVKNSGHGRELSAIGMREFCNTKSVIVQAPVLASVSKSSDAI
jgi:succinate-semialdehyde dehydrogenase/glutarate-semialdehyde dehydrogenase